MAAPTDIFSFPPCFDIKTLPCLDKKVCVVTIIGKNRLNGFTTKASILNPVLDRDVFLGTESFLGKQIDRGEIECYYDTDSQVIYLHYQSLSDASKLANKCQQLVDKSMDLISLWQDEDFLYAKRLLFLFCVSHIVLLSHPGSTFDISYVKLFRTLDTVRIKLQPFMTDVLRGFPISKDWQDGARPCSPRVLFIFDTPTVDVGFDDGDSLGLSRSRSQRTPPIKKLQHNMEDQIYRIFRKSRIITNISNNSLFAVPANQEFVFVNSRSAEVADPVGMYLQQLKSYSVSGKDSESPKTRSYLTNRRMNHGSSSDGPRSPVSSRSSEQSFKEFLLQHIELAFSKGFDDNVGRNPLRSIFEMTSCDVWFSVALSLHKFFFTDTPEGKVLTHFNSLGSLISTDVRFSETRCSKILPLAENAYQQDLPQHYITKYHFSKLAQAKRVFSQFARGPAYEKYLKELEESCEQWWKSGHQQCEETSLTGNLCLNPLHRLSEDFETDENRHLPLMSHSSQIKTKAACNCGLKQADKDDPFDHKYANFGFYQTLEETCCGKLQHFNFPVFNPSTSDVRAGQVTSTPHTKLSVRDSLKLDVTGPVTSSLSLALSLGQSGGSDLYGHRSEASLNPEQSETVETSQTASAAEPVIADAEGHLLLTCRQHSTTEYLPGMIHSESPGGLLPLFQSWSLCCMGKSTLYSHIHGFDLPGFLTGSNFLLPWDITLQAVKEKWPIVGETAGKKGRQRRIPQKEIGEVTVRAFLGMEYECPRGHRFFCSGPEKIIKVSSASTVKDNATKLLSLDMPLYCPCHCRNTKGYIAQLMRVYVVTPESAVKILLKPCVQPSVSSSPLFEPGSESPIELSSGSVWVLRLPHVYLGDHGVYTMPTDPQHLHACRLLKGMFSYKEA